VEKIYFPNGIDVEIERVAEGLSVRILVPEAMRQRFVNDVMRTVSGVGAYMPFAGPIFQQIRNVVSVARKVGEEPPPK